jgi:hypothetical protein
MILVTINRLESVSQLTFTFMHQARSHLVLAGFFTDDNLNFSNPITGATAIVERLCDEQEIL